MENGKFGGVRTPKLLNRLTKFGVGLDDYSGDITLHAIAPVGGGLGASWQIDENHCRVVFSFFVTPNFAHIPRLNLRTDFYAVK